MIVPNCQQHQLTNNLTPTSFHQPSSLCRAYPLVSVRQRFCLPDHPSTHSPLTSHPHKKHLTGLFPLHSMLHSSFLCQLTKVQSVCALSIDNFSFAIDKGLVSFSCLSWQLLSLPYNCTWEFLYKNTCQLTKVQSVLALSIDKGLVCFTFVNWQR